ncbi:MAG: pectinesterase family protein [Verrucomicrobiota bacterium]
MRTQQKSAVLLGLLLATASPSRATTVFNDTFSSGSTINNVTPTPANPSLGAAAYQEVTAKTFKPNPPTLVSGALTYGITSTSSGFCSIEALFTKYPLVLSNTGDYVEATVTFTAQGGVITDQTNSGLFFGLYNANQIQPKLGGLNATSNTALAGYAASWKGYCSRIYYTGGANGIYTRPAQTDTGANNQDLLYQYSSGAVVGSTSTSTVGLFVTGSQYTGVYRITRASATTLTIGATLYSGAGIGGTQLFTQSATTTSVLTDTFDALSMGWRATGSVDSAVSLNSVNIVTNAATTILPVIESPPLAQTRGVGENVDLSVVANGGGNPASAGLNYQWYKNDSLITLGENSTAQSAILNFPSTALTDTGDYRVTITNAAGTVMSTSVTLTITDGPIPPTIVTDPAGATILVGGSKTFAVSAYGTAILTYQWERSTDGGTVYNPISGATGSSYEIASALLSNAGHYRCVVSNDHGSDTSAPAVLAVNQAPAISVQPVGATLNIGDPLTLSVTATGTPAPTYQWKKNGVNISDATTSSYSVVSVTGADTSSYTVVVTNSVTSVTSSAAAVAVLSPTLATTTVSPASAATGRNPDTRLAMTFNAAVTAGVTGFLRIHDASNGAVVDTIDFAAASALRASLSPASTLNLPVQNQSIGGVTNFNYYPLTISGNTVTVYPRNGTLAYGKSYYVKIDAGAFVNTAGESFSGIGDNSTWTFGTKAAGPAAAAAKLTVTADGTGDFDTVQGALDWIPSGNTVPRLIDIRNGSYFEQVVFTNKHNLTLLGEDRTQTTVVYPNNNNFNNVSGFYHRSTFIASNVHDITVENLKFHNTTPQGGSQAEAFILSGSAVFTARNIVNKCNFYSYQDTVQISRQCYINDCYIEGDTDFMWGSGPCFFNNCDIKILRTGGYFAQVRNDSGSHGFVYANCRFTAGAGFTGNFLNRIDPKSTGFPYSEVVVLNSKIGDATNNTLLNTTIGANGSDYRAAWWLLNGTTSPTTETTNIRNWNYNTTDGNDAPLNIAGGPAFTLMPTDPTTIAHYSDPFWVLNSTWAGVVTGAWTPSLLPSFTTQPQSQTVAAGASLTLTAAALRTVSYQWYLDASPISGATSTSYQIPSFSGANSGSYTVVATNTTGSTPSAPAILASDTPYNAYVLGFGLNPATNGAWDQDPEHDGMNNRLEFFLGANPTTSDLGKLPASHTTTGPPASVFEFDRNTAAASVTYVVESCSALDTWVPVVDGTNGATIVTTPVNASKDHITVTLPMSGSSTFVRLRLP